MLDLQKSVRFIMFPLLAFLVVISGTDHQTFSFLVFQIEREIELQDYLLFHIQEHSGVFRNIQEHSGTLRNIQEHSGTSNF